MSASTSNDDLKVNLSGPLNNTNGAYESFKVTGSMDRVMEISLRRTVRVPVNQTTHTLPPNCGPFPIYNVLDFATRLPSKLVAKGGAFVPIYQREAMWISFTTSRPFVVKVYVGGINAVSGESSIETPGTMPHRKQLPRNNEPIQDYVVLPSQLWLGGITNKDGKVMQFVAAPTGSGYSVESQITGGDTVASIQFEIVPASLKYLKKEYKAPKVDPIMIKSATKYKTYEGRPKIMWPVPTITVRVKTLGGKVIVLQVAPSNEIWDLKVMVQDVTGFPVNQQNIIFKGKLLEDNRTLVDYGIQQGSVTHLVLRLRGGGDGSALDSGADSSREMAVAAGGSISQVIVADQYPSRVWAPEASIMFNLQIINSTLFPKLLGIEAPPTPIDAKTYAEYGYPFFGLDEQVAGIDGDFPVQSVGALDKAQGGNEEVHVDEKDLAFPVIHFNVSKDRDEPTAIMLNRVDQKSIFLPVRELKEKANKQSCIAS